MKSVFWGFKFCDLFFYFFEVLLEYDVVFVVDVIFSYGFVWVVLVLRFSEVVLLFEVEVFDEFSGVFFEVEFWNKKGVLEGLSWDSL